MTETALQDAPPASGYYGNARPEMLEFIPATAHRLLDVGCSEGRFGAAVKSEMPGCEVWGVEPFADAAAEAARRLDKVINAGLAEAEASLPRGYFDVIVMNDVLEHIDYSEPALATAKRLLSPGGSLVLSLPNVRYFLNVRDLLFRKDWEYVEQGVLDRTHLRFFTQKSATRLLQDNGFEITTVKGITRAHLKLHYRLLFALSRRLFADMPYLQFAFVCRPA